VQDLPRNAAVRKINELVKRARMAKVHALIIGHLKSQMPFFGQQSKQKQLLENLADEFFAIMKKHRLPQVRFVRRNFTVPLANHLPSAAGRFPQHCSL
jgi:EH domain-containing protein 3/EH domain-containing protein 1